MSTLKTKALEQIEQRMEGMDQGSLRFLILKSAKQFKISWVELGRSLYTAWKERMFRQWGYQTFEAYTAKEIGIRKSTALKLLKSYYFLEKERAPYLKEDYLNTAEAARVPAYESIDLLRRAKERDDLDPRGLATLTRDVFEKGKEPAEVRKELTSLIRQREELDPDEAREKKKTAVVKRLIGTLKSLHRDTQLLKLLPSDLLSEIERIVKKLEAHVK
ncbi:MAG: hypothetical protein NT045_09165 [Candidatus Aureabacteria bacterium]|nr:hypothetical protein [Candidatus Auribacterota bacterium]